MRREDNELKILRVYDAPVKLVWDAWTDPAKVAKWWGPRGFTITTHSKDLRPGGHWAYTMHGPDGTNWENKTIYHEVEKYSRLVYDHGGNDDRPPLFRVTVTFKEEKGKTTMDMTMALSSPEAAIEISKHIRRAQGNSTWDRLAEFLSDKDKFVINRTFEASIKKLKDSWHNLMADNSTPPTLDFEFSEEGTEYTRVTGTTEISGNVSKTEMTIRWNETFDKFEESLRK